MASVPVTTLNRAQFAQFLPNEQSIRWAESLQQAAQSFVSGGGGGSLTPSGVTAGNYGDNANVGAFTVDINGIVTAAANTPIAIAFTAVSGVVPITQGGTGETTATLAINALLPTQSAGTVGWYLQSNGTVCSWQPAPGGGGGGTVTQVDGVAGEITGGPITVTGTLGLATTGVAAASYGSASSVAQVTFDTKGRATSASSVTIAITGAQVSGNIAGNAANVTGVVAVANGGSGATTLTGYLKGNGTSAFTAVSSVPASDISGTLLVANGGTGAATFTAGYLKASGTSAFTTVTTIPQADVTGLAASLAAKADNTITITGATSLTGGGDLTANRTLSLVNDSGSPGVLKYYGTDSGGTKGFYTLPSPGVGISLVTNTDGALIVTNPAGPTVNIDAGTIPVASGGTGVKVKLFADNIAAMTAYTTAQLTDGQTIDVLGYATRDDGGGGVFYWDSASTATVNTGTIFQSASGGVGRLLRLNDTDIVNWLWFGVDNALGTDSSTEQQAAYSYASPGGGLNRTLYAPAGYYNGSLNLTTQFVSLLGAGIASTQLRPFVATDSILTLTDTSGTLYPLSITDLTLASSSRQGIGIDHATAGPSGGSSGRELVQRVEFNNLDIAVNRQYGDFTCWYYDNFFSNTNYHFYSLSTSYGHAGDIIVSGGNMGGADLACFYFDSTLGQSGKIVLENITIQANDGYVLFVKNMNVGQTGVPAPVIRECWNEGNYLGGSITVGGVTGNPVWGYFKNDPGYVGLWLIENMAPGPMTIINFNVRTTNCDLTYTTGTTFDAESTLVHDGARWINDKNIIGFVNSVTYIDKGSGTAAAVGSWYQTKQLLLVGKVPGATNKLRSDGSTNITYTKSGGGTVTTANATDNGIAALATCQDLTITGTDTWDGPNTGAGTVSTGYLCWVWVGKLISGTPPELRCGISTGSHISLYRTIDETDFVTLKGMVPLDASVSFYGFEFSSTGNCVVRCAGYSIDHFTSLAQAIDYLNSPVFPA